MTRDPRLSEREYLALCYAADGLKNKEIARRMRISPHTLDNHLLNAYRALGVDDRVSALRAAGILVPSRPRRRRAEQDTTLGLVEA